MKTDLTRREFLKMTGTGLAIAVATTSTGFRLLSAAELEKDGPASGRASGSKCGLIISSS